MLIYKTEDMIKKNNALLNGFLIYGLISIYFLVLVLFGLSDNMYLRFANLVFVAFGINETMKLSNAGGDNYLDKVKSGLVTALSGILPSCVGLFLYMQIIDPTLAYTAHTLIPIHGPVEFTAVIFIEGLSSSLMVLFVMLQYWKNAESPLAKYK